MPAPVPAPGGAGLVRRVRRNGVYLAVFVMDLSMASGLLAATYYAKEEFGATAPQLGLFALVSAGSYVAASLVFGRLSDRWGRRNSIYLACFVDAIALALMVHAASLWQLYALMTLFCIGQGAFWPALEADISDNSTPAELPVRVGRFNVAWCSGFAVAGLGAGALGQFCGQLTVLAMAAALICAALLLYLIRTFEPEARTRPEPEACADRRTASRVGTVWTMALVLNFAVMGLNGSLRYHMPSVTGEGRSALGGTFQGILFTSEVLTFALLARWHGWHFRAAPLFGGVALTLAGGLLCGLCPPNYGFGIGCALIGVGCGIIYYSSIYYSMAAESDRGRRGGVHESVLGLGAALIPYLGGVLTAVSWAGERLKRPTGTPFLTASVIIAVALLVAIGMYLRVRKAPASPPPERR